MAFNYAGIDGISSRENVERGNISERVLGLSSFKGQGQEGPAKKTHIAGEKLGEDGITDSKRGKLFSFQRE